MWYPAASRWSTGMVSRNMGFLGIPSQMWMSSLAPPSISTFRARFSFSQAALKSPVEPGQVFWAPDTAMFTAEAHHLGLPFSHPVLLLFAAYQELLDVQLRWGPILVSSSEQRCLATGSAHHLGARRVVPQRRDVKEGIRHTVR